MKKKAVIVSGYFNPIHKGHLEYFNNAKGMADDFFVIVNNDTIPERPIYEKMGVALIYGLGDKIQSSSWLLNKL
jgi:cytidyltransferase-like protein